MANKLKILHIQAVKGRFGNGSRRTKRSKIILAVLMAIAAGSLFLIVMPYLPRLYFIVFKPKINATPYQAAAAKTKGESNSAVSTLPKEKGNRLVLPDIGVDAEIIEGRNIYAIGKNQGVWRETSKIDPTKNGNIVLAGHRWLYTVTNGGYFYNLTELKVGNKIYIRWGDKVYEYEVINTKTVYPTQVNIRDADPNVPKKLTMYTCYPLGSTAKRFVVEAKQL